MHSAVKEILITLISALSSVDNGVIFGFSAIALPQLLHQESWLQISEDEASWIASLPALSFCLGSVIISCLMDILGRKRCIQLQCLPRIVGWLLLAFAPNVYYIYAGRLLTGLGGGMMDSTVQVYIGEVTTPYMRNFLASVPTLLFAIGMLHVYILGALNLPWDLVAVVSALLPFVHLLLLLCILPESPVWLRVKGRSEEAKKTLKWFGKSDDDFSKEEANETPKPAGAYATPEISPWKSLLSRSSRRPVLTMLCFFFFQQFSGMNAIIFYAVQIFQSADNGLLTTNQSAIVIGATRLLVATISCCILSHIGRRTVTIISGAGMAVSMTCLGAVVLVYGTPPLVASLACISAFIAFNTFGFLSIPWIMMGEILPEKCRGLASGLVSSIAYIYIFIVVKIYPYGLALLGEGYIFLVFGAVAASGAIFVYLFIPETRGKTLQEIEQSFCK